jgi:hypothetical protein
MDPSLFGVGWANKQRWGYRPKYEVQYGIVELKVIKTSKKLSRYSYNSNSIYSSSFNW